MDRKFLELGIAHKSEDQPEDRDSQADPEERRAVNAEEMLRAEIREGQIGLAAVGEYGAGPAEEDEKGNTTEKGSIRETSHLRIPFFRLRQLRKEWISAGEGCYFPHAGRATRLCPVFLTRPK